MAKILAVEDAYDSQVLLKGILEPEHEIVVVPSALEIVNRVIKEQPDLILMDIVLPDSDGYRACQELQSNPRTSNVPVLFVTGKRDPAEIQFGFSLGAEDYITKPFHPLELKARCDTRLRKSRQKTNLDTLTFGPIILNIVKRSVSIKSSLEENEIQVSPAEFQLLLFLCKKENQLLSREDIRNGAASKNSVDVDTRVVDAQISSLRRKSKFLAKAIQSVYGAGYRLNLSFESGRNDSK